MWKGKKDTHDHGAFGPTGQVGNGWNGLKHEKETTAQTVRGTRISHLD